MWSTNSSIFRFSSILWFLNFLSRGPHNLALISRNTGLTLFCEAMKGYFGMKEYFATKEYFGTGAIKAPEVP